MLCVYKMQFITICTYLFLFCSDFRMKSDILKVCIHVWANIFRLFLYRFSTKKKTDPVCHLYSLLGCGIIAVFTVAICHFIHPSQTSTIRLAISLFLNNVNSPLPCIKCMRRMRESAWSWHFAKIFISLFCQGFIWADTLEAVLKSASIRVNV